MDITSIVVGDVCDGGSIEAIEAILSRESMVAIKLMIFS